MADGALPGFRDFYPDDFAQRAHIFRAWREVCRRYAFVEYDGPPLEPLELYTKKSGDEIVNQLYAFTDKGGREVALRPEMTPTFARMVAARANSLRKPVRWFSIPQLFRYERQQKGRLKEHFQLNVDIVGEPTELADAELLAVAIDCMRELGLTHQDVHARVSDRGLVDEILLDIGVQAGQLGDVYAVLDRVRKQPEEASRERLSQAKLDRSMVDGIMRLADRNSASEMMRHHGSNRPGAPAFLRFQAYLEHLDNFGLRDWVELDLSVVRGLAYYTGIVFELYDTRGALRAICGGGRYDTLLRDLGGADLPALGFGMGDVVLAELLKERGLMPDASGSGADLYFIGGNGVLDHPISDALRLVSRLRRVAGMSVDYAVNAERYKAQASRNQMESAKKSGARAAIYFESANDVVVQGLAGKVKDAPKQAFAAEPLLHGSDDALAFLKQWFDQNIPKHPRTTD
jgi:histidyl-tRNA synthetase